MIRISEFFIYLTSFFLGFNYIKLFLLSGTIMIALNWKYFLKTTFKYKNVWSLLILVMLFCMSLLIGDFFYKILNNRGIFVVGFFLKFFLFSCAFIVSEKENSQYVILSFVIGFIFFLEVNYVAMSLVNYSGADYGYFNVLNIFTGEEHHSAGFSNLTAFASFFLCFEFVKSKNKILNLLLALMFCYLIYQGFFYSGRAYFIIVSLGLFLLMAHYIYLKSVRKVYSTLLLILIFTGSLISFPLFYQEKNIRVITKTVNKGMGSGRYLLWKDGIQKVFDKPLGGYLPDQSIENKDWFHNLWLDSSRTGGIAAILLLLLINIYIFKISFPSFFYTSKNYFAELFIFQILFLASAFQDVPLESYPQAFVLYLGTGVYFFMHKYNENKTSGI